ncbi:SRPBCC family protein [Nonomuraea sp. NPDC050790]|uniref:SRPBCC family protein n=1 Tax=Nonomuraea sp. NPDC050790 TaxID=3364371 RepID=UPI0037A1F37B
MIERSVRIAARRQTVYRHFTDPVRLARWWGQAEADVRPGGVFRVAMEGGPRPVMLGEFVELVPYERVVFTFGWEPAPGVPAVPPGSSLVEVTLAEDGDATVVTVRHSGLPAVLEGETGAGWEHTLRRLFDITEQPSA